ncbi:MAG TPA: HEAT repeat domain-containing protein [Gemmataceae bacterium]|nr:HEAT repeat domain-containing protein [Gemmataceae bacterium]
MSAPRLVGLFLIAALIAALCVPDTSTSAQVKLPPTIKPGGSFPGGGLPKTPPPTTPPPSGGKNPSPMQPNSPGGPSSPGFPGSGGSGKPGEKKDNVKWPEKVGGKTVDEIVKDMKSSDPAIREGAVRTLPAFGPKGREFGGTALVDMMTKDSDISVRAAALEVAATVLYHYAKAPDTTLTNGIAAMVRSLGATQLAVRLAAVGAIGSIGPYVRTPEPKILALLTTQAKESSSWQFRRIAVAALGSVGQGVPLNEEGDKRDAPDRLAVTSLLDILKNDACDVVQRDAVTTLIGLGPVAGDQQKKWRADLDYVIKTEKDKSIVLWTRVCILRNDPSGVEGNLAHLEAVAKVLEAPEAQGRLEACNAFGILGEEGKSKLEALLGIIDNAKEEPAVVGAAIMAVATMKSQLKIILPALQRAQLHPNEDVRKVATEAILVVTGQKKN